MFTRGTVLAAGTAGSAALLATAHVASWQRELDEAGDPRGEILDGAVWQVLPITLGGMALSPLIRHFGGAVPQLRWIADRVLIGASIGGFAGLGLARLDASDAVIGTAALAPLAISAGISAPTIARNVRGYMQPRPLGEAAAVLRTNAEAINAGGRVSSRTITRNLAAPLDEIAGSARGHARSATSDVERELLARISRVANENSQRVHRDLKDGWKNHPDYGQLGRMASDIELFDAVRLAARRIDDPIDRAARLRQSDEAAEILTW